MQSDIYVPAHPAGRPLLRFLASFPIACFSGALATDIAYVGTADILWADFSVWLLALGMATGVLAGLVGLIALVSRSRDPLAEGSVQPLVVGSLLVLILGLFDNLVHSRDAWTSVMPAGLALSAVIVVVILLTVFAGSAALHRPMYATESRR
jgi:uncharacterized membrane protein